MGTLLSTLRRRLRASSVRALLSDLWYFLRDSTPERRRACFGDLDYDFDHQVDTTASNLPTTTRLAGAIAGAGYQPIESDFFHHILAQLALDYSSFTFLDIGSGKGRALLLASDYPFRRIVGVELLPELHRVALENISKYKSHHQRCFAIESLRLDALDFEFPPDPLFVFLFNPLPESGLRVVFDHLARSISAQPRVSYLVYANPIHEYLLSASPAWIRLFGNEQYAVYRWHYAGS